MSETEKPATAGTPPVTEAVSPAPAPQPTAPPAGPAAGTTPAAAAPSPAPAPGAAPAEPKKYANIDKIRRKFDRPADRPVGPPPAAGKPGEQKRTPPPPAPGKVPELRPDQVFGGAPSLRLKDLDKEIEREMAAAMGEFTDVMAKEPAKPNRKPAPAEPGAKKKGKIISIHGPDVFVHLPGGRSEGVLPLMQFEGMTPAVGDEVEVDIEGYDPANGLLLLTREGAAVQVDWSSVAVGQTVEARVTAVNKGGLAVEVNGIRGFMPISQIDMYRVENTEQYVNQRLKCLVAEVDPIEKNLVVSRRGLLERDREENREKTWAELAEGQIRPGIVRSMKDFGVFVDIGGVDGLLHVSEMSWARVQNPAEVVQLGETIKVVVLKLDREKRKVSLGLKQLAASPWDTISSRLASNDPIPGKVTRIMEFGAFVEIEPGIEGLIHISELAPQRVWRVGDVVKPGQDVMVRVLKIDAPARKISLSLKAAQAKPPEPDVEEDEDEEVEVKPERPRTTPLRGGVGDR